MSLIDPVNNPAGNVDVSIPGLEADEKFVGVDSPIVRDGADGLVVVEQLEAASGGDIGDDPGVAKKWWLGQAWVEMRRIVWLPRSKVPALLSGLFILIMVFLGVAVGFDDAFGRVILSLYGGGGSKSAGLAGALTIGDMFFGLAAVLSILAHRSSDGGLSSLGGLNQSKLASSSSATGRRLDLIAYGSVAAFMLLSAVLAYYAG